MCLGCENPQRCHLDFSSPNLAPESKMMRDNCSQRVCARALAESMLECDPMLSNKVAVATSFYTNGKVCCFQLYPTSPVAARRPMERSFNRTHIATLTACLKQMHETRRANLSSLTMPQSRHRTISLSSVWPWALCDHNHGWTWSRVVR